MLNLPFLKSGRERRRAEVRRAPFPDAYCGWLREHVAHYELLTDEEAARLHDDLRVFMTEKRWEGAGGATVTEEMRAVIAAQACLLLLGRDDLRDALFPNVESVIVYPGVYRARRRQAVGYLETVEDEAMHGEAWSGDWPVVLSWESVKRGGEDDQDGHNLVLHEFAHKLDMVDGGADGVPRLTDRTAYEEWARVMSEAFRRLRRDVWTGRDSVLDEYGAESEPEFFAVCTEAFFEKAVQLEAQEPEVYGALKGYYGQDTAARVRAGRAAAQDRDDRTDGDEA